MKKIILCLCAFLLICLIVSPNDKADSSSTSVSKIEVPKSSSAYVGDDYVSVVSSLNAIGFTNVKLTASPTDDISVVGTVKQISIDGESNFDLGNKYEGSSVVVITYYCEAIENTATISEEKTEVKQEESTTEKDNESATEGVIYSEVVVADSGGAFDYSSVPEYSDSAYAVINGNVPFFTESEITTTAYEYYSELDSLGRCGVCIASVGQEIMPTEARGAIGSVKPTGWHTVKYSNIDGNYLYNRCHLLGYQLTGENANPKNLITGTRYLNVTGMLPFENMIADYVKETGNHVMYRVTPVFEGDNLLANGVLMEAKSVEDDGDGILFNVFCYNVQPGIQIDYATGDSSLIGEEQTQATTVAQQQTVKDSSSQSDSYMVNAKNGKIHKVGKCSATSTTKNPVYFDSYDEAEAYSIANYPKQTSRQCGNCWR